MLRTCARIIPPFLLLPAIALAAEHYTQDANLPAELMQKYRSSIKTLALAVNVSKKHRSAIIDRMDNVSIRLDDVGEQIQQVIHREPSLRHGIEDAEKQIERLSERIDNTKESIQTLLSQIENLPTPSLLEDALGKSLPKRRARAVSQYRKFEAENLLASLTKQRDDLLVGKGSLYASFGEMKGSIRLLHSEQQQLVEKEQELERQFIDLSAEIVHKQDRQNQLQERMDDLLQKPELASFSVAQGRLPAPTPGELKHAYGEPKAQGLLKWEGIVISAPIGEEVTAVFDGSVVFVGNMQSLGNVAIVDHGEGFMSLYGMTDFLLVEPDQTVLAGDTIGTVGTVPGTDNSGLYFEIRRDADTLNPAEWLESYLFSANSES